MSPTTCAALNSSEEKQAQFIRESFAAWDDHADHIRMIDFTWLTDQSPETVAYFQEYYSFSSGNFAEFLGTLGLRALDALREEAARRGLAD